MKILITGASGTIASSLISHLVGNNHHVTGVSRQPVPISTGLYRRISWRRLNYAFLLSNRFDAIVNMAGAPMMQRWSDTNKALILNSRLEATTRLYSLVRHLPKSVQPECVINASSVAIYSSRQDAADEWTRPHSESTFFQARVWQIVESRIRQLRIPGVRTVVTRLGIVIGTDRLMRSMLKASRLYLGTVLGTGNQKLSWIAQRDLLRAFEHLLEHQGKAGVYNLVSPQCIDARTFSREIAAAVDRPVVLRLPEVLLKQLFGELASNFLVSAEVKPKRLIDDGFEWELPGYSDAVRDVAQSFAPPIPAEKDESPSAQLSAMS